MRKTRVSYFLTLAAAAGFGIGIFFMTSMGAKGTHRYDFDEPSTSPEQISPQAKSLLNAFSEAFQASAARINPSVVPIQTESIAKIHDPFGNMFGDDFFRRFFGDVPHGDMKQTQHSLGSGVIVTRDGYILTNNHVVDNAEKLTVELANKRKYTAKIVGRDPQTDIAVIKIDATDLPVATLGNSDSLKVGQWVIAVGNPFNLNHTVTAGIISAKGRTMPDLGAQYQDFIQTDASINPGNSGGALADLDGNVVGINTAIFSPNGGGNVGIGFAVPINMARDVMRSLIDKGKVVRGYMGLLPQDIDPSLAKGLNLKTTDGALVGDVTKNGPAEKAGFKRGDIITEFNGAKISGSTQLRNLVAEAEPGTNAKVSVLRDGKPLDITVKLGERPAKLASKDTEENSEDTDHKASEKLGFSVKSLSGEEADRLGYKDEHGVVISNVKPGSPAEEAGLQPGDLIKEVNRQAVASVSDFDKAVRKLGDDDTAAFLVRRGENTFFVAIQG